MFGLAYASVWLAYQRFCAAFHVTAQDVGLGPSGGLGDVISIVARLGVWLAIVLSRWLYLR